jgi:hypothetical protein
MRLLTASLMVTQKPKCWVSEFTQVKDGEMLGFLVANFRFGDAKAIRLLYIVHYKIVPILKVAIDEAKSPESRYQNSALS